MSGPIRNEKSKLSQINVERIMTTEVYAVTLDQTVSDALKLLLDHKISGAPVVDKMNNVVSMVSEGDLLKLTAMDGLEKPIALCLPHLVKKENIIFTTKSETFIDVYKKFLRHPVHRLAVIDSAGRLQGFVTRSTLLKAIVSAGGL